MVAAQYTFLNVCCVICPGYTLQRLHRLHLGCRETWSGCYGDRGHGYEAPGDVHRQTVVFPRSRLQNRRSAAHQGLHQSLRFERQALGAGHAEVPGGRGVGGRREQDEEDHVGPVLEQSSAFLQIPVHCGEG